MLLAIFVGIQFVPVDGIGNNPPARFKIDAPPEVEAILRRSCFDCHTNETRWPWYSRMAPAAWLVLRDVKKGRARVNMSEWGDSDEEERTTDKENGWEQIEAGNMPPWFYLPMHPDGRLSDADKATLKTWLLAKPKAPDKKPAPAPTEEKPAPAEPAPPENK